MVDEGAVYYCKYGCTRMWPKVGSFIEDRFEWERKSGLVTGHHVLDGYLDPAELRRLK